MVQAIWQSMQAHPKEWFDTSLGVVGLVLSVFSIWFAWYALHRSSVELEISAKKLEATTVDSVSSLETLIRDVASTVNAAKQISIDLEDTVKRIDSGLLKDLRKHHDVAFELLIKHAQQLVDMRSSDLHSRKNDGTMAGGDGSPDLQPVGEQMGIRSQLPSGLSADVVDQVREQVDRAIALLCSGERRQFKSSQFFDVLESSGLRASNDVLAAVSILLDYRTEQKLSWDAPDLTTRTQIEVKNIKYFRTLH